MGVAPPRLWLNGLGSIAVLIIVAAIGIGLPALDRAVAADRPLRAGAAYLVGAGVSLVPPAGATLDAGRTRPGRDRGTAVFRVGALRLAVQAATYDGLLPAAAARLRTKLTVGAGCQIVGTEQPAVTTSGVPGVQGRYLNGQRAGRYAVYVASGVAVEATVEGPLGTTNESAPQSLASTAPQSLASMALQSLASITIGSRR